MKGKTLFFYYASSGTRLPHAPGWAWCQGRLSRSFVLAHGRDPRSPTLFGGAVQRRAPQGVGRAQRGGRERQQALHHPAGAADRQVQHAPPLAVHRVRARACHTTHAS